MKKLLYTTLLVIITLSPVKVLAEGYISVSPSSLTIEQGSSKTIKITAYNTIGDVSIKSNDNSIASVNSSEWGTGMVDEKQTKTTSITVTGKKIGKTTITLVIDAATYDGEDLQGQTKTVTVNVVAAPPPKSKNNNIKSINIEGYNLVKVDNNNYTLTVEKDVTSISINATAEDSKATITETGSHELNIGENNIQVIVTSESGAQNIINIKVTRKDGYYLEDLETVLTKQNIKEADIIIENDSKITSEHLNKIKESKKQIRLNYYDETKKLVYSWSISGDIINNIKDFTTKISFTTENKKEISKLSNYADGIYINFNHNGDLPKGTKIKLYTGDKFENGSTVNLYHYNKTDNSLDFITNDLKVNDSYIEFEVEHCSEYFATMSNIVNATEIKTPFASINIYIIIGTIVVIALITFIIFKIKSNKKKSKILENTNDNNYDEFPNAEEKTNDNNLNTTLNETPILNATNVEVPQFIENEINNIFVENEEITNDNNLNTSVKEVPQENNIKVEVPKTIEFNNDIFNTPTLNKNINNNLYTNEISFQNLNAMNVVTTQPIEKNNNTFNNYALNQDQTNNNVNNNVSVTKNMSDVSVVSSQQTENTFNSYVLNQNINTSKNIDLTNNNLYQWHNE